MSGDAGSTPSLADELEALAMRAEAGEFCGIAVVAFGEDLTIHFSIMGAAVDDPLTALGSIEVIRARLISAIEAAAENEPTH